MLPTAIKLHKKTATLELSYSDGSNHELSAELLRVYSPSAEVKGHGIGQEVLQIEKMHVKISSIESIGNYAIKLYFDDDHDTGIYTWGYLRDLCLHKEAMWQEYLDRLHAAGARREALPQGTQVLHFQPPKPQDNNK